MGSVNDAKHSSVPDCMENCRSRLHGKEVCILGTGVTTEAVVALWVKKCANYPHVKDEFGRNALHVVASTGNSEALGWLIKRAGSEIDKKDKISGYTALHRSIYFGQIHVARSLIMYNGDVNSKDNEGMTPFELCHADRPRKFLCSTRSDPTELLVWGTNDNYTLGSTQNQKQDCPVPEQIDLFRKSSTRIMQAIISSYHSVFLTQSGEAFTCGTGRGGKLGLDHELSVLKPEVVTIKTTSKCIQVAAGNDHTLFLLENGRVLSCGSNEYGVLGQKCAITQLLIPKYIDLSQKITVKGIVAARYHSVFYSPKKLYICGTSLGQLGCSTEKGQIIYEPKPVTQIPLDPEGESKLTLVSCFDNCTVARTNAGLIYLFYKFECYKINAKHLNVEKIKVIGGCINEPWVGEKIGKPFKEDHRADDPLTLLMLTTTGRIVIWRENISTIENSSSQINGTFSRIIFNTGRSVLDISDFCVSQTCIALVTTSGEAYRSPWTPNNTPILIPSLQQRSLSVQADKNDFQISSGSRRAQKGKDAGLFSVYLEHLKLKRIKGIYSAGAISCDLKGNNFAIIQASPKLDLTQLPDVEEPKINRDLFQLLNQVNEEDSLHDVVFTVGLQRFPAHLFVIATSCPKLYSLVNDVSKLTSSTPTIVPIPNVDGMIFVQLLQFIYSNKCDLLTPGKRIEGKGDIQKIAIETAKKFDLESMCKELRKIEIVNGVVAVKDKKSNPLAANKSFDPKAFGVLADITLQNPKGFCVMAHKCILISRMEYFYSMLYANSWLEKGSNKPLSLQLSDVALNTLIDFVYTDCAHNLPALDFDALGEILAMSDTFFMERLRTLTEYALTDLLTLKNVSSMIYLADRCNANQLKESCMQFLSLNLAVVLESRLLDPLPIEIVKEFSKYYCDFHPTMKRRFLKPASEAPDPQDYFTEYASLSSDLLSQMTLCAEDEEIKRPQTKSNRSKQRLRSRTSECEVEVSLASKPAKQQHDEDNKVSNRSLDHEHLSSDVPGILSSTTSKDEVNTPKQQNPQRPICVPTPRNTMANLKIKEMMDNVECKSIPLMNSLDFPSLNGKNIGISLQSPTPSPKSALQNIMEAQFTGNVTRRIKSTSETISTESQVKDHTEKINPSKKKTKWKSLSVNNGTNNAENENGLITKQSPNVISDRDPVNPWKVKALAVQKVAFKEIVQEEVEKKENLERAVTKSLTLMQIEDQAINELVKMYTSQDVQDGIELISVDRVCSNNFANPTWVSSSFGNSMQWPKSSH